MISWQNGCSRIMLPGDSFYMLPNGLIRGKVTFEIESERGACQLLQWPIFLENVNRRIRDCCVKLRQLWLAWEALGESAWMLSKRNWKTNWLKSSSRPLRSEPRSKLWSKVPEYPI